MAAIEAFPWRIAPWLTPSKAARLGRLWLSRYGYILHDEAPETAALLVAANSPLVVAGRRGRDMPDRGFAHQAVGNLHVSESGCSTSDGGEVCCSA
jgi:hypothetical protein